MRSLLLLTALAGCGLLDTAPLDWTGFDTEPLSFRRPPAVQVDERGPVATFSLAVPQAATLEVVTPSGDARQFPANGTPSVELPIPEAPPSFRYRVVAGNLASPWQTYREPQSLTLAVLGDSRPDSGALQPPVFHQLMGIVAEQATAAVMVGDLVQLTPSKVRPITQGWVTDVYDHFLQAANPVMGTIPFLPVLGNHEAPWSDKAEAGYQTAFVVPQNGRADRYYSRDVGGAHLVVLDSEENFLFKKARLSDHQMAWLEKDLANRRHQRAFVFLHRPLFGGSHKDDFGNGNEVQRDQLHAMFRRHGISAVFAGHDHRYDYRLVDGIPYVITGGAGSPIRSRDESPNTPAEWFAHHWVKVEVSPQKVTGDAIGLDGSRLHHWEIR